MSDGAPGVELLREAQERKIDRLLDLTNVGPGTRLLEIGSGWGELARRAARRGAKVRTITLSERQLAYTRQQAELAGLADSVQVELRDYRDTEGQYDAVLSVEMIEAVGKEHWPAYFSSLSRLLAPGGRVGLQAITMPHDRMLATARTQTWIIKYIFPGGLIPSMTAIRQNAARAGLHIRDDLSFGTHYARTLALWGSVCWPMRAVWAPWASMRPSGARGGCIWPTRRPDSPRATWTCTSSCSAASRSPRRPERDRGPRPGRPSVR